MNVISIIEILPRLLNEIPAIIVHAFHGIGLGIPENYARSPEGSDMLTVLPIIGIITIAVWMANTSK